MSKDAPQLHDLPLPKTDDTMQASLDQFSNFLHAPVRKLDADEYTANDLDGVTESATGSGNLNFLMMQAGQTNEAMGNANPFNIASGDNLHFNALNGGNGFAPAVPATSNGFDTAMDRPFDGGNGFDGRGEQNGLSNTSSNAGSLGASNLAANTAALNPFTSATNYTASSTSDKQTNTPPDSPTNGTNGTSGTDGTNGTDGTGTTIINIDDRVTNLGDVINNSTTNLGDVINNSTTNLFDTINNATTNIFDTVNNTTNNLTEIVNNFFDGDGLGPLGISLDVVLDDVLDLTLDAINGDVITNLINETIDLSPVLNPVQSLVGDLLSHTSLDILLNPFQPDNSANDYDLHVGTDLELLGLQIPDLGIDVPLDIAEALLGDIDIGLDLTNDLLGVPVVGDVLGGILGGGTGNGDTDLALGGLGGLLDADVTNGIVETLLNPVENLIGDIDIGGAIGLDLLGLNSGQTGPDTDISIPIDIALIDNPLFDDVLDISLDPLENIVGDIDLDLGVAGNILGDVAAPLFDTMTGGNGQNDLLNQLGDGLSDLAGGLIPIGAGGDTDLSLGTGIDLLDTGLADNGLGLVLNPVEDLAGDIDIGGNIGLDLLGTAGGDGTDTDITLPIDFNLLGDTLLNDGLDINLDPLESITGDIDIDLGAAANILGDVAPNMFDNQDGGSNSNDLLAQAGDGLSDLAGGLLGNTVPDIIDPLTPGISETIDNINSLSHDASAGLDTVLGTTGGDTDTALAWAIPGIHETIDNVGTITNPVLDNLDILGGAAQGGIDEDLGNLDSLLDSINALIQPVLDTAIGVLNSSTPSTGGLDLGALTGGLGGGTDAGSTITTWTETILPSAGDLLGGGLHNDPVSMMPDPVITAPVISLPIPVVPVAPILGAGGLLGHHGHGGLFG